MPSLLNVIIADKVKELLDLPALQTYGPEEKRSIPREQAEAIIHAVLWGHSSRADATAGAYACLELMQALKLAFWSWDEVEAAACVEVRRRLWKERAEAQIAAQAESK